MSSQDILAAINVEKILLPTEEILSTDQMVQIVRNHPETLGLGLFVKISLTK